MITWKKLNDSRKELGVSFFIGGSRISGTFDVLLSILSWILRGTENQTVPGTYPWICVS